MAGKKPQLTAEQALRLEKIAKKLGLAFAEFNGPFITEVRRACLKVVKPVISAAGPETGAEVCEALSHHFGVRFEEVYWPGDVERLKKQYLEGQGELGFAQLDAEMTGNNVDALLFKRMRPEPNVKHVAVLNLQGGESRAYWSRFHELVHRIAEPQQDILPLRRHKFEAKNPVERLVDETAGYLAFYRPIFRPLVLIAAEDFQFLTIDVVEGIREAYAPTASLQSTMNAVVRDWPRPAHAITAKLRGKKHQPEAVALRGAPQGKNEAAKRDGLFIIPNMRVPESSPIYRALMEDKAEGTDDLSQWSTSNGKRLKGEVYSSALRLGDVVYAILAAA